MPNASVYYPDRFKKYPATDIETQTETLKVRKSGGMKSIRRNRTPSSQTYRIQRISISSILLSGPGDTRHRDRKNQVWTRIRSAIAHDNLIATQFHLEKSGRVGLKMLNNFLNL